MQPKKTKIANLENRRNTFFVIGLVIALSLILISFEWTTFTSSSQNAVILNDIDFEPEIIQRIKRDDPKPEPKPALPKIIEALKIMDDNIELEPVEFNVEVTGKTKYDYFIPPTNEVEKIKGEKDFFYKVEEMPTFNGGLPDREFNRFITKHLRYPEIAAENGVSGKVIVQFDIDLKGNLIDAIIYRGIDPALDKEALRVIMTSPRWTPGKQRNKPVKVRYTFPINFVLQ